MVLLGASEVVRLRTRQHPSAEQLAHVASYDEWYERATSFESLYADIAEDLVALAANSPSREVLYVVPGSPVVAERTVELLRGRDDVTIECEPAVSVIDVAGSRLGRDPMSEGLRVVDALDSSKSFRGPGPMLVLQTYSREVMANVAECLALESKVIVLHHLGLDDELIVETTARGLGSFEPVDHLTSLWVEQFRDAGVATNDLVELMKRLRVACPWDQEQTHASLIRHLLEEAYEVIDALEAYSRVDVGAPSNEGLRRHVEEELGDLFFQIIFHAELGDEVGDFSLTSIADGLYAKLVSRHPHVFGDVKVADSNDVARRWEELKREEKGRSSVTDGVVWQLPSMLLYSKLLRKAATLGVNDLLGSESRERAIRSLGALTFEEHAARDAYSTSDADSSWGDAIVAIVGAALYAGVDLEGVLRDRATRLRDAIKEVELRK
jgi:tetrapyrrole methylase family protein/MazG family protein